MTGIQDRIVAYHQERFPRCAPYEVVYKAMEELGEVAKASQPESHDDPVGECADVVIVLMVLAGRFHGADLMAAVEGKLAILTTPGAHRNSVRGADL